MSTSTQFWGGSLSYHRFDLEGKIADQTRSDLVAKVEAHPNIEVTLNATCNAWFADNYLPVIQGKRMYKVRAKECIVASGAFEQHVVFRNNDLPGIVVCSAVSRLMKLYAVKPGRRAVLLTGNDDAYFTALDLYEQGVEVAAIVDMRAQGGAQSVTAAVQNLGIKNHLRFPLSMKP